MFQNKGLAFKITFFIMTCCTVIFAVMLFYNYKISRQLILDKVKENAENVTFSSSRQIEKAIIAAEKIPSNVTIFLENLKYTENDINNLLKSLLQKNKEIYGICVAYEPYAFKSENKYFSPYAHKTGDTVEIINIGKKTYEYFYMDWYQIPRETGRAFWSEPYFDEGGGNIVMSTYSAPFYDDKDGYKVFKGVVSVDISLEWLEKIVSSIKIFNAGYGFLISHNGTILTHPQKDLVMNESIFSIAEEMKYPELREIGQKMIKGESGLYRFKSILGTQDSWLFFAPLPSCGWSLASVYPEGELFSDLQMLNAALVIIAAVGFFALFTIIRFISNKITSPLRELAGITKLIGSGDFDAVLPVLHSHDEIGHLNSAFSSMQNALKEYIKNLKTTTLIKERIESELKVAHDIQMSIIPKTFPPYPHRPEFDIYAVLEPAKEVGGDLYDFFLIDDSRFCFAIGDVAGKGVPASLFMAITRTLLHAKFSRSLKLARIVESINEDLSTNNENMMFVTFFVGILDTSNGSIEYCNAGHNPPYIVRANGEVEETPKTKDTPLGIMPRTFSVGNISLGLGDSIFLFTDGVTEAISSDNKFYGEDRLKGILKNTAGKKSKEVVCEVLADIKTFAKDAEQSDDITELQIKFINKTVKKAVENKEAKKMIIKNKLPELAKVAELIEEIGEKWGVSQKTVIDINVCMEELIVNTISYGYSGDVEREIEISVTREERAIKIRIEDDGLEFDPLKAAAPVDIDKPLMERNIGGLGIHFVKNLMDDFEYERTDGKNIVTLTKNI